MDNQMNIPFHKNYGHRCAQAAMKSIIEARLPKDKQLPFKELDKLTLHNDPEITLPIQIAYGFHQLGIPFEYYVKPNGLNMAQSPNSHRYFRKYYGEEIISKVNIDSLDEIIKELKNNIGTIKTKTKPSIEILENKISQGKIPICLVNWDVFNHQQNKFSGHYITPTEIKEGYITYHDSGPHKAAPNKKIPIETFQKAWDLCLMDHDLIIA